MDVLLATFGTILLIGDYSQWKKKKRQEEEQRELLADTDKELLECKKKLENLSDYITKRPMNKVSPCCFAPYERKKSGYFSKKEMQDCIVRMENLLHTVLYGKEPKTKTMYV